MEISFEGPPLRTDVICIGTLQLASKMAAFKAANAYPDLSCAMWAQVDEVGIALRGILLSKPWFREAKTERIRCDSLTDPEGAELVISEALERLTAQLT
jgi:hypothetical protein